MGQYQARGLLGLDVVGAIWFLVNLIVESIRGQGAMICRESMKPKSTALFLWSVVCLVSLGATGLVAPVQAQDKPNVILIVVDDMGWGFNQSLDPGR